MNLKLSIKNIRSVTGADFIDSNGLSEDFFIQNVVIDSRSPLINNHTLFVILTGNKTSGEKYVPDFVQKGGTVVLTDKQLLNAEVAQIVVPNVLRALQKIAVHHRKQFDIPVIGITGSNGKTTVKEWLYHVLKEKYQIVRSPKSYNSQIGVALSVLEMNAQHELAIFEAGISRPGEMEHLEKMIQPTIGIFTGIGDAHNSGFNPENPEEEKRREKFKLFDRVKVLVEEAGTHMSIKEDSEKSNYSIQSRANTLVLEDEEGSKATYNVPFSNKASISNAALVALTVGLFDVDSNLLQKQLKSLPTISMRLEKISGKNDNLLINDVYSLDEKSLEIGVQYLNANKDGKSTAVFIAEDSSTVNASTTLLTALQRIKAQIQIDTVVYFGPESIAKEYPFIDRFYAKTEDFSEAPVHLENKAILFTGSRNCHLEIVVNAFTEKKHITRLSINLENIRKNLNVFRDRIKSETTILAMVKAQSYGGGILEMAKFLEEENVGYFGVAYADEGVILRKGGIQKPILVMNPEPAAFDDMIDYDLEPSIYSTELLNAFIHQLILRRRINFPIHIKLDTGMNRLGFREEQFPLLLEMVATQPEVFVKSVFSHLSVADDGEEGAYTRDQIQKFIAQTGKIEKGLGYGFIRHLANSAGAYHYPEAHFDMVRLGIGLFGLLEESKQAGFENVLRLSSQISQVRAIKAGESVGYSRAFKAEKDTTIGIIPVGYSDGLRRGLSKGKWSVIIHETKYPIIGNVCMDMCMVDLGNDPVKAGDEVQLFGDGNSIFAMSKVLDTIPYEIISSISSRVHRVYTEE